MKRKILLSLVIATTTCTLTHAQIKKGSTLLGGYVNFSASKEKYDAPMQDYKTSEVGIFPAWGKAVKDNLIVGVDIMYAYQKYQPADPTWQKIKYSSVGAGFFIRKYATLGKGFYLFGQGRLGASSFNQKYESPYPASAYTVKGYSIDANFYPGLSYAVNNKLQVEAGFGNLVSLDFTHRNIKPNQPTNGNTERKSNGFGVSTSLSNLGSFSIGLRMVLSKV